MAGENVWYVCWNGTEPYVLEEDELTAQHAAGLLDDDSVLIWTAGQSDWHPISELPALLEVRAPVRYAAVSVVTGSIFGGAVVKEIQSDELPNMPAWQMPAWELSAHAADPFSTEPDDPPSPEQSPSPHAAADPSGAGGGEALAEPRPSGGSPGPPQPLPEELSKFGRLLRELVETERSYLQSVEQLLSNYRPALEPLAPTLLSAVFDELLPIRAPRPT